MEMVVEVMKQTPKEKKFNHPSVRKVLSFKGPFIYKECYASNTLVWQNLVRCIKSFKIFLLKTIFCRASNASELDDIHSLAFTCFLVRGVCTHFVNLLLPVHLCLFSSETEHLSISHIEGFGSPSHVVHAHQKWFSVDLIHFSII